MNLELKQIFVMLFLKMDGLKTVQMKMMNVLQTSMTVLVYVMALQLLMNVVFVVVMVQVVQLLILHLELLMHPQELLKYCYLMQALLVVSNLMLLAYL